MIFPTYQVSILLLMLYFSYIIFSNNNIFQSYDTFKIRIGEGRKPKTTPRDNIEILRDDLQYKAGFSMYIF